MKPFVLVAAAAMALASCQKNEMPAPEKQDVHFTINAGIETKTSIVESLEDGKPIYKAQWDGNEELGLLFAAPNKDTEAKDVVKLTNKAEVGELASFQGNVTLPEGTETSGTFYSFYPASAFTKGYTEGDARLDLKNIQKPTATSFDPTCDILVAKPYDYTVEEGAVVAEGLEFARIMSVLRIDLKSEFADVQNEFVESVSFTAGDVEITGYARIFLDNPKFDKWASNGTQWCTVTANYDSDLVSINGESKSVYLVIAPVTIPANKELTFEIKTKNYKISKTVKSPEMTFTAGKVSKINLTIASDNCEKIDQSIDYSGEYLIVNTDLTKAASKWADGNNLPAVDLQTENGVVYETENIADCKMIITKVAEGDNAGKYTIQDANGKYLYAAGGSGDNPKNQLKGADDESYWTIECDGVKYVMTSLSGATRNILRYNATNNPPIFSCYGSGQSDVTLYKYSDLAPDTRQKLEITTATLNLESDASTGSIDVTAKNLPSDLQVRALTAEDAQEEVNWLTVTYADGKITYTATTNESEDARTAYIEAYVSDDLKDGVAVTQAGKPAAGAPTEVTDVLTRATTGVANNGGYSAWSGKTAQSSAVYAGQSAGGNDAIQLRTTNSNSGIVTTTSGGHVKKIVVTWQSATQSGRILDVYGKNTAYTAATDLYDTSKQGTKLGSIKCGTSTELVITGDYQYIGLRSNGSAMYLTEIAITWSSESGNGSGETPEPIVLSAPVVSCTNQTETSLTFGWPAVDNASKYEVTFNNGTPTEITSTSYEATGLTANTKYAISVKAVGDGVSYTTSPAGTAEGTTKEAQQPGETKKYFVKVTSAPSDWSGTYLIVYESGKVAFDGSLTTLDAAKNTKSVTISNDKIEATDAMKAITFTITKSGTNYTVKSKSGYYIGQTSNANGLKSSTSTTYANTMSFNSSDKSVNFVSGSAYLRFNAASSDMRFRYYKSSSYTNQNAIHLYKLVD